MINPCLLKHCTALTIILAALGGQPGAAQDTKNAATGGYDLRYVPQQTMMVFSARTAEMAKVKSLQPLRPLADIFLREFNVKTELQPEDCDQVSMVVVMAPQIGLSMEPVIVFQCNKDLKLIQKPKINANARRSYRFREYTPDARTLIVGRERVLDGFHQLIAERPEAPAWTDQLKDAEGSHFLWVTNTALFGQIMGVNRGRGLAFPMFAFDPFWQDAKTVVFHATAGEKVTGSISAVCNDARGAERVVKTTDAVCVLLENLLRGMGNGGFPVRGEEAAIINAGVKFGDELLKSRRFDVKDNVVTVNLSTELKSGEDFVASMVPILEQEQRRMEQFRRTGNLRQIVLALHNYHDTHKRFPAAVLTAKDGKTKYSWRVAILPFLDHQALYEQYKFDEPWNSKSNLAVLRQMPDVFRHPSEDQSSYKSAYYGIVGRRTAFGEAEKGTRIRDHTDGTSNTIIVVEAKQGIPWTKPSDLTFEDDGPLPGLGGFNEAGFYAAFADGSAQLIPKGTDKTLLRNLIMRNDGNAVKRPGVPRF